MGRLARSSFVNIIFFLSKLQQRLAGLWEMYVQQQQDCSTLVCSRLLPLLQLLC